MWRGNCWCVVGEFRAKLYDPWTHLGGNRDYLFGVCDPSISSSCSTIHGRTLSLVNKHEQAEHQKVLGFFMFSAKSKTLSTLIEKQLITNLKECHVKKLIIPAVAMIAVCALSGCTRTSYAIHTVDGRTIVSDGKPTETDAGLVGYTDANGVKQQINKREVKIVSEIPNK